MDYRKVVNNVRIILNMDKISWSRAIAACKKSSEDGFTEDDFILAAKNMAAGDSKYISLYSVFTKTDYWMSKRPDNSLPKGVWL